MKNFLWLSLMSLLIVSCSSKEKKTEEQPTPTTTATQGTEPESPVSSELKFNPMGSDSGQINGLYTINFDYDKATLNAKAKELLTKNAEWIKSNPKVPIQLEGHCDERGSVEYNFALGERRARATKDFLVSLGVEADRLKIISYGKEKPLDKGDSDEAYAKNRRANFVPLPQ